MDYRVAIPSYRRANTLRSKTLSLIVDRGIPPDRIDVFVADEFDHTVYARTLPYEWYENLVIAKPGMCAVRNFINDYYEVGTKVLNLDDDLDDVILKISDKRTEPVQDLHALTETGFQLAEKAGLRLWGIYPVSNPYFMNFRARFDLTYIEGAWWGVTIGRGEECYVSLEDKEDFERTIRYYLADGGVVRLEDVAMVTNFYTEPGGMQYDGARTDDRVLGSAQALVEMFPDLVSLNTTKRSGKAEVRLRDRR